MNEETAGDTKNLMLSYQEGLYAMLDSLHQLESHLKNIQARTFQMTEEISYLVDDNLRLLRSVNKQVLPSSEKEPCAPDTPFAPAAPWKSTDGGNASSD
ncbi:unnamed protein product [Fusarium langsethiae]|nr:unnamed protein product [Fusarium langsethiae]